MVVGLDMLGEDIEWEVGTDPLPIQTVLIHIRGHLGEK